MSTLTQSWNLHSIYVDDAACAKDLSLVEDKCLFDPTALEESILKLQEGAALLKQVESYIMCRMAADSQDPSLRVYHERVQGLKAVFDQAQMEMRRSLSVLSEEGIKDLLGRPALKKIAFFLQEQREWAGKLLDLDQESLITDLSVDGYHSFWGLYQLIISKMVILFEGEEKSVGQVESLLNHANSAIRSRAFVAWKKAWETQADMCGQILNHLAGFRLQVYQHRSWKSVLEEPLHLNRMQKQTLDTLWSVVEGARPILRRYLKRKADLLGVKGLSWVDLQAPLNASLTLSYEKGVEIVLQSFERFHPPMARFAEHAMKHQWIESEDRTGKQSGGFCTQFPCSKESRIFMTFTGTMNNVLVLAHELGHAYHSECLKQMPYFAQDYAMNVAETASTLAEMILVDGATNGSRSKQEKQQLLEDKLQRAATFLLNLHARFLFEKAFYEERRKGFVPVSRLSELMLSAQRETCGEILSEGEPLFWASKLHFYATDQPFYNFPYTFGYLLSLGLYALAQRKGSAFIDGFLKDTAQMTVEDLGKKHLNMDLSQPPFWQQGIEHLAQDVEAFCAL